MAAPTLERQGAHTLLTTAASVLIGLMLSVLVARTLGPEGKGMLDVASASIGLFTLVLGGSLNSALAYRLASLPTRPKGLVLRLGIWGLVAGVVTMAMLGASPRLSSQLGLLPGSDSVFWLIFIGVSAGFGIWAAGLRGMLIGRHHLITANRIDLAIKAGLLVAYLALAASALASPRAFGFVGMGAAILLALLLFFAQLEPSQHTPGLWPALLATALPVHGTNILHFLNQRADIFFLQASHGAREVGLYALAVSLAQCLLLASSALAQPLLPKLAHASPAEAAEIAARLCRLFLTLAVPGGLGLTALGWWAIPAVFGRDFSASLPSLAVLLPGVIAFGLTNILISYFVGIDRARLNVAISVAALTVTLVGNLTLTPAYGALGAAGASLLAYGFAGLVSLLAFARISGLPLARTVIPDRNDLQAAFGLVRALRL